MSMNQTIEQRVENNGLSAVDLSNETTAIADKILSSETLIEPGEVIYGLLELYDITKDIYAAGEKLRCLAGPEVQTEKVISEIPPEGIIITQPGVYTLKPDNKTIGAKKKTITWAPVLDVGAAITIASDDVTLDMNGCSLAAKVQDSSAHLVGIFALGSSRVTIKNGALTNMCLYGIQAELVEKLVIENILVSGLEYNNTKLRNSCPAGIQVNLAKNISISDCSVQYFYATCDLCAAIQVTNTISGSISNCNVKEVINYAGVVQGFSYITSSQVTTSNCTADSLRSHFGSNVRTGGHTVLGFLPVLSEGLSFTHCSASNIVGSCDDCHGMSVFFNANVTVDNFTANNVTDGVTEFNTGAKATGLEVYGIDVKVHNSAVDNIIAINPQDRQCTGFSAWGAGIEFVNCTASNVAVTNDTDDPDVIIGMGMGFGWAPDPRLYHTGAIGVKYDNCTAINCQVGFDTWNHIDSEWINPSYTNCGVNILVEPGGTRTVYGDPCTECNPPVTIHLTNQARNNIFPGSQTVKPSLRYAYPTGNINGLSVPSALSRLNDVNTQWWFYVGLLRDADNNDHSFELTFIEPGGLGGDLGITAVDLDFTFSDDGDDFHVTSTFGGNGPLNVVQSVINMLGISKVSASKDTFEIDVKSSSGPNVQVAFDNENSTNMPAMFTGQIGQPGAVYTLKGKGTTWLWKHSASGKGECALYQYQLNVEVVDERGLVGEGLGSYVGINPLNPPPTPMNSSVEYAQPRLRVKSWSIELVRHKEPVLITLLEELEGFKERYSFQSGSEDPGLLWLDRQALFTASPARSGPGRTAIANTLATVKSAFGTQQIVEALLDETPEATTHVAEHVAKAISAPEADGQLYTGCWLPVILTEGPYAGATLLFTAFWNSAQQRAKYDTNAGSGEYGAKPNSFMNLYTGIIGGNTYDPQSAYTISDILNPKEAYQGDKGSTNNYRIHFTKQFDKIGNLPDPERWGSEIKVTVNKHTQARYALSAYAHRAGNTEPQGPDTDLTFTIKALNRYTTTTPLSSILAAPVFEGASRIYASDGTEVGVGWIEQMVGKPS